MNSETYYQKYHAIKYKKILCEYCFVYCSKYDKHYKTDLHLDNISKILQINRCLLTKNKFNKRN